MSSVEIESTIKKLIAKTLRVDESKINLESNFVDDLGADSLDQVELMMAIEAEFDCDIPDEDAGKITTVADAVKYIEQKKSSAPAA
ncbi:MAG: acyl carrier protein [Rickettsiaceae bacterium]|nr:acyl carrier protein [Rickettsiaceae bacterium]